MKRIDPAHIVDVFVYVIVLNLVAQYAPRVITASFSTSLAMALLLKIVLEVVLRVKGWAKAQFNQADSPGAKAVGLGMLALVLPGSKLVVLELVALLFGDSVSLGGFFVVTALILGLLLSTFGVRQLLDIDPHRPGASAST